MRDTRTYQWQAVHKGVQVISLSRTELGTVSNNTTQKIRYIHFLYLTAPRHSELRCNPRA
jgi:hypothetical protein